MPKHKVTLRDRYTQHEGRIHLRGSQAMVRILMIQRLRDHAAGLNTAGFVTGYRGSPMTAIDEELWRVEGLLKEHHTKFWPGTNEHLAMTAIWGSQQTNYFNDSLYDGVYGMWYGKGPGLDQCMDALRQGNWHGAGKNGGVLVCAGDDHNMTSTINNYSSELLFQDLFMPVLYPADIQEVLDYGLLGIELSRFSGCWTGYKLLPETIETSASVDASINRIQIVKPEFEFPPEGLNAFAADSVYVQEARIRNYRLPAAVAFARANNLNRVTQSSPNPRIGILTMGKSWRDVRQALHDLGISDQQASDSGITIMKVGMPYPADLETYAEFARGLEEVIVVEEKKDVLESGLMKACYGLPESERPRIVGRRDEYGQPLLNNALPITADEVTLAVASRIHPVVSSETMEQRIARLQSQVQSEQLPALNTQRVPYFCSGCPHNTSTKVPEGSRGQGGVGCHYMVTWMDRETYGFCQMGGEGITWVGQAPFVKTNHVFQNLGDGTYFHSGSHAIRASVTAGTNITYKILFNDAVAMTGGQPVDGTLTVPQISHQVRQEGVKRIAVVTDEPEKYNGSSGLARDTTIHHRKELDQVQREMRDIPGVTVLIYDQTCATEKRRRRKRGTFPDPAKRYIINDRVCEGCGDCGLQSNCVSIQPLETDFGRKRQIDQSTCNKDYSCVDGFCPSFVTVIGGELAKSKKADNESLDPPISAVPEPDITALPDAGSYNFLVTGVGGTGVVTIGALLGMAAHIDNLGVSVVDQLGFAQKGGAVLTHLKFARQQDEINASRINKGTADALLACDMLVAGADNALAVVDPERTKAIINTEENYTGDFTRNSDLAFPAATLLDRLKMKTSEDGRAIFNATAIARKLMGDSIAANLMMVGHAWQSGLLPVSKDAIIEAIELNGVSVDWNKKAFDWGRCFSHDPSLIEEHLQPTQTVQPLIFKPSTTKDWIEKFADELVLYQDEKYAERYRNLVDSVVAREAEIGDKTELSTTIAKAAYKLMAYKDEYEVGRLLSDPAFMEKLESQFQGNYKLQFNLAPPIISPTDKKTGAPAKMAFGSWMMSGFKLLAKLKFLRGTALDIFGYLPERKEERQLITEYFATVENLLNDLTADNYQLAVEIAGQPMAIRGYGHVKNNNILDVKARTEKLTAEWPEAESKQDRQVA